MSAVTFLSKLTILVSFGLCKQPCAQQEGGDQTWVLKAKASQAASVASMRQQQGQSPSLRPNHKPTINLKTVSVQEAWLSEGHRLVPAAGRLSPSRASVPGARQCPLTIHRPCCSNEPPHPCSAHCGPKSDSSNVSEHVNHRQC